MLKHIIFHPSKKGCHQRVKGCWMQKRSFTQWLVRRVCVHHRKKPYQNGHSIVPTNQQAVNETAAPVSVLNFEEHSFCFSVGVFVALPLSVLKSSWLENGLFSIPFTTISSLPSRAYNKRTLRIMPARTALKLYRGMNGWKFVFPPRFLTRPQRDRP